MKYTRLEFKGQRSRNFKKDDLKFFILVPVIAIALGFAASRLFIIPSLNKLNNTNTLPKKTYTFEPIKAKRYFLFQAGIYSSENNARAAADRIKAGGAASYIRQDGQYFRVIIFISPDSSVIEDKRKEYISAGYDCLVKEINIGGPEIPQELKSKNEIILTNRIINYAGDEIDNFYNLSLSYQSKQIDNKALYGKISAFDSEMKKRMDDYKALKDKKDVFVDQAVESCQTVNSIFIDETLKDGKALQSNYFQGKLLQAIYLYNDMLNTYVTECAKLKSTTP